MTNTVPCKLHADSVSFYVTLMNILLNGSVVCTCVPVCVCMYAVCTDQ